MIYSRDPSIQNTIVVLSLTKLCVSHTLLVLRVLLVPGYVVSLAADECVCRGGRLSFALQDV